MSILHYFKQASGLPDPKGPLSSAISSRAIAEANKQVQEALGGEKNAKRGPYQRYSPALRAEIAEYTRRQGAAATARRYRLIVGESISESTIKSIKKKYLEELKKDREMTMIQVCKLFLKRNVVGKSCWASSWMN